MALEKSISIGDMVTRFTIPDTSEILAAFSGSKKPKKPDNVVNLRKETSGYDNFVSPVMNGRAVGLALKQQVAEKLKGLSPNEIDASVERIANEVVGEFMAEILEVIGGDISLEIDVNTMISQNNPGQEDVVAKIVKPITEVTVVREDKTPPKNLSAARQAQLEQHFKKGNRRNGARSQ